MRAHYCVWDEATGEVLESGRGPAGFARVQDWPSPPGQRLRVLRKDARPWLLRYDADTEAPVYGFAAGIETVESPSEIPNAGGSIDPATGEVTEAQTPAAAELAVRDALRARQGVEGRARVVRAMHFEARRVLRDWLAVRAIFDITDTEFVHVDELAQYQAIRGRLLDLIDAAVTAGSRAELREAWRQFRRRVRV